MEIVEFITVESGDDLIVSFAIRGAEPNEIRSLTLQRTPKYENLLDNSKRGVNISDEDFDEEGDDFLEAVELRSDEVQIISKKSGYQLDCSEVDVEELEAAKNILLAMNFDSRFRLDIN
jgi:hypothetical protein